MNASDLSGFWAGTYFYPMGLSAPVNFDLELTQSGNSLSGHITEPNTFIEHEGPLAVAVITGMRSGAAIRFVKTYRGAHDVNYSGTVNEDGTAIDGQWQAGFWSGTFTLTRETGQSAAKSRKSEISEKV